MTGNPERALPTSLFMALLLVAHSWGATHRETPLVRAIKQVRPAVVNIHSQKVAAGTSESSPGRMSGMGTGVVVDERGYIITNYHVIEDVSSIRVTLVDGSTFHADVVARDQETDLALLRITPLGPLQVMPLGRSDDLMYGETVVAIGNAFGYEHTITQGIVSEMHRDVRLSDKQWYRDLIQTDASINPGNSGGPLINMDGEMIGLNVAIRAGAQGIGFAIPVNDVKKILVKLLSVRRLNGTWHGIVPTEAPADEKVMIAKVEPGSPAEQAGIRAGEGILSVDGRRIQSSFDVERALLDKQASDHVMIRVVGNEGEREVKLDLVVAPEGEIVSVDNQVWDRLGVRLVPLGDRSQLNGVSKELRGGLLVHEIKSGSPAEQAGLQIGDILVGMQDFEMLGESHIRYVLQTHGKSEPLTFHVVRNGRMYRGTVQIASRR